MENFSQQFRQAFIEGDRYLLLLSGLRNTLIITVFALIIGLLIGIFIAIVRSAHDKRGGLNILNFLCRIYLTVIRGTPTMVQLMIMYFIILVNVNNAVIVAIAAFGINSGAYIAEIIRSGIMSVDEGQYEAGRSLGLNYAVTMKKIVMPQAFKNVLPALGNEFITLLKETSISGYVGIFELTRAGNIIMSRTYQAFMPLIGIAVIYLIVVVFLTYLLGRLEKRLRNSER